MWIKSASSAGIIFINLDNIARIDYTPPHTGTDDDDKRVRVPAYLRIFYAVPDININGYGDSSSDGGTSLMEQRFHDHTAEQLWQEIESKTK